MGLFDVHAHLTHSRLRDDVDAVLDRAQAAGLTSIIANGLNPGDNERVAELAARAPIVKPAYGFYPVDTVLPEMRALGEDYPRDDRDWTAEEGIASVRERAADAVAIGEIGLDGHWVPESLWAKQEEVFRELVAIALDAGKPIIIHTRKREARAFEILKELGVERACWHCFGGRVKLARRIAEHGHYLSIPANARRSEAFTRMIETLPRERILLETDCPYLAPEPGTRNEPANVAGTAAYAAELWEEPLEAVTERLEQNFERLFGVGA